MPFDVSDAAHARRLALTRFGPTLFRCRACQHEHGWQLKCRPRVWQCKACRRQQSILSGTALQGAKLPLEAFMVRFDLAEAQQLVSSRALAGQLGIAPSSAWHLNQRIMAVAAAARPPGPDRGLFVVEVKCRNPRPSPPLHPETPATIRDLRSRFMLGRPPHRAPTSIETLGARLVLHRAGLSDSDRRDVRQRPSIDKRFHLGFERWFRATMHEVFRAVSLRWLPRYLSHVLHIWNRRHRRADLRAEHLPLLDRALLSPPMPLRSLRPYDRLPVQEPGLSMAA